MRLRLYVLLCVIGLVVLTIAQATPPKNFPERSIFSIAEGSSVSEVAVNLEGKKLIRSSFLFKILSRLNNNHVVSGDYFFESREGIFSIESKLRNGDHDILPVSVTIPEGLSSKEIAVLFEEKLPQFDEKDFIARAKPLEGYLFPDTYNFFPSASADLIVQTMSNNFNEKTATLKQAALKQKRSWNDVIIMASIVEDEGKDSLSRRMIADILWRRLDEGMRLQVDASFANLLGKTSAELTEKDLAIDSPYNTYRNTGLPPTPITNPGIDSISAALYPLPNTFVYYLSDDDGNTRYSTTFEEHIEKKELYLE